LKADLCVFILKHGVLFGKKLKNHFPEGFETACHGIWSPKGINLTENTEIFYINPDSDPAILFFERDVSTV